MTSCGSFRAVARSTGNPTKLHHCSRLLEGVDELRPCCVFANRFANDPIYCTPYQRTQLVDNTRKKLLWKWFRHGGKQKSGGDYSRILKKYPDRILLMESLGSYSIQIMGDHEPEETFSSAVITMCSNFILPCPRRHSSPTWTSNGNSYPVSVGLREGEGENLTSLLFKRSEMCHWIRLETSWTDLLLVTGSGKAL